MSQQKLVQEISSELQKINEEIDFKIIKGFPYRREARRHKMLLSMLNDVSKRSSVKTSFSFLSFLL